MNGDVFRPSHFRAVVRYDGLPNLVYICTTRENCTMNYSSFLNPVIGTVHPSFWYLLVSPIIFAMKWLLIAYTLTLIHSQFKRSQTPSSILNTSPTLFRHHHSFLYWGQTCDTWSEYRGIL